MRSLRRAAARLRVLAAAAAFVVIVRAPLPAAPSLPHLRGVEELKAWFNAEQGHPRLVLLLSPT